MEEGGSNRFRRRREEAEEAEEAEDAEEAKADPCARRWRDAPAGVQRKEQRATTFHSLCVSACLGREGLDRATSITSRSGMRCRRAARPPQPPGWWVGGGWGGGGGVAHPPGTQVHTITPSAFHPTCR
uniref:Uncharacterized protein n=1 Tax=Knipowitschia caucasica TaxID=637954 RepID=A0AAV2JQ14_KNICA